MTTLYTIGHSTKPVTDLVRELHAHDITILIDVRSVPFSKRCPQFNRFDLEKSLAAQGIQYIFRGHNLGGKGENVRYQEVIDEVSQMAAQKACAIMCSEADYHKCHRHYMLEPDFRAKGVNVVHIEPKGFANLSLGV